MLLVPMTFALWYWIGYGYGGDVSRMLWNLAWADVGMLLFNLLPVWPLDGGRVAQAAMSAWLGGARSKLVSSIAGLACATAGMAWFIHVGSIVAVAMLLALLFVNVRVLQWSLAMLAAERHWGFDETAVCPACGSRALNGPTGPCQHCGETCNLLSNSGRCWSCGAVGTAISCPYCGQTTSLKDWCAAAPK